MLWQNIAGGCQQTFENSLKMKVMGLNPGYLLKYFLLYYWISWTTHFQWRHILKLKKKSFCLLTNGWIQFSYYPSFLSHNLWLPLKDLFKILMEMVLAIWKELSPELTIYVRFISYSKCSNWRRISKLASTFGCLFTFCNLDRAYSIKTYLHICNLWTGQFVSYKSVI